MARPHIGFVGIGSMGAPMAKRVRGGGYPLTVFDIDRARADALAGEIQCRSAASLADLGGGADIVITMVQNGDIVREIMFGEGGVASTLRPGGILVDMSSADATGTRAMGPKLAEQGIAMVDAPVSGGAWGAASGTLSIMIGADDEAAFEAVEPLLRTMGDKLFRVGGLGTGHAAKALNNMVAAISVAGCAEAYLMAREFGLDPARIFEIINVSTGQSWNSNLMASKRLPDPSQPLGFAMELMAKDLGLAADLARDLHLQAPITHAAHRIFAEASAALGPADIARLIPWLEEISGDRPPSC
jgi:3-hydroxyisobutyrate dehydrogenase